MVEKKKSTRAKPKKTSKRKDASKIETLLQMSSAMVSDRYLDEILQLMVRMTADIMGSKICSIMLLVDAGNELEIKATQALSEEYRLKPPLKVGQSISGKAVKEKRPIMALDVTKEPLYMFPVIAKKEGLKSIVSVPMMVKDRVIGVINSYTTQEHRFTKEEVEFLQIVANQAAIAIENTKLLNRTIAMEEALETRKAVERAKGILMKRYSISEDESFKMIQRQSMNTRRSVKEIAEALILTSEIEPKDKK
ncbi:MAG: GAF and ANTAR domain-containing protein [Actinomycetota bacterium]